MDFNKIIDNIRISINKENEIDNLIDLKTRSKINGPNEKKQTSVINSFDYNIKKNFGPKKNIENKEPKNITKILNEEETNKMIEDDIENLKLNNWNNLTHIIKKDRLKEYILKKKFLNKENKNKIYKTLISKLNKDLLNETNIIYNKELGEIENIKILLLKEEEDNFKFIKLKE